MASLLLSAGAGVDQHWVPPRSDYPDR